MTYERGGGGIATIGTEPKPEETIDSVFAYKTGTFTSDVSEPDFEPIPTKLGNTIFTFVLRAFGYSPRYEKSIEFRKR